MSVEAGTPLILADGTKVYPDGKVEKPLLLTNSIEVPTHEEAQRLVVSTRRSIHDLPALPKQLNAVSAVLSYSLFGLPDAEIGLATGLTEQQVGLIKVSDAYLMMHDAVVKSIIDSDGDDIRQMFVRHSRRAASKVNNLIDSENEAIALNAAKDILDRAGHRPADVVEHRHKLDGGLTIEVIKRDQTQLPPVIDLIAE